MFGGVVCALLLAMAVLRPGAVSVPEPKVLYIMLDERIPEEGAPLRSHEHSAPVSVAAGPLGAATVAAGARGLPLGPAELEALRRVAMILAALGEQVIPAIAGSLPAVIPAGVGVN